MIRIVEGYRVEYINLSISPAIRDVVQEDACQVGLGQSNVARTLDFVIDYEQARGLRIGSTVKLTLEFEEA